MIINHTPKRPWHHDYSYQRSPPGCSRDSALRLTVVSCFPASRCCYCGLLLRLERRKRVFGFDYGQPHKNGPNRYPLRYNDRKGTKCWAISTELVPHTSPHSHNTQMSPLEWKVYDTIMVRSLLLPLLRCIRSVTMIGWKKRRLSG